MVKLQGHRGCMWLVAPVWGHNTSPVILNSCLLLGELGFGCVPGSISLCTYGIPELPGPGQLPWWTALDMYCHNLLLGKSCVTPPGKYTWEFCPVSLQVHFLFADLVLL